MEHKDWVTDRFRSFVQDGYISQDTAQQLLNDSGNTNVE